MQPLKIIPLLGPNHSFTEEQIDCFHLHLKSLGVAFVPFLDTCFSSLPHQILKILKEEKSSVVLLEPSLRIVTQTHRFFAPVCDMACFVNPKSRAGSENFIDRDFLLFHPFENTVNLIEDWAKKLESKGKLNLFCCLSLAIKNRALSTRIFSLDPLLKKEAVNDSPFFHRWLVKI
ncbi:MAG: hypothetical protein ACOYL1_04160 [Chlamydiia bacterium]